MNTQHTTYRLTDGLQTAASHVAFQPPYTLHIQMISLLAFLALSGATSEAAQLYRAAEQVPLTRRSTGNVVWVGVGGRKSHWEKQLMAPLHNLLRVVLER